MRNTERCSTSKQNSKRPIQKRGRRCAYFRNRRRRSVGMENLECINEALRHHKGYGHGYGSWRLVPKDSLEVYKYQRDRSTNKIYKRPTNSQQKRTAVKDKRNDKKYVSPSTSGEEENVSEAESWYSEEKPARTPKRADKRANTGKKKGNTKKDPKKARSESTVSSRGSSTDTSASEYTTSRRSSTDMEE